MSRLLFEAHPRAQRPMARASAVLVEPPPELPRIPTVSLLRKALPWVIGLLIVGMLVALVATGMRLVSPQTLFFPFVLLLAAVGLFRGTGQKTAVGEIDAERADYLRYLSALRGEVRERSAVQRGALEWSHPVPIDLAAVSGTPRQWERDPGDEDFLVVRAGVRAVPASTTLRVGDVSDEIDLEPVCHSALRALVATQRDLPGAPAGIDLRAFRSITVLGSRPEARGVVRAWAAQAVTWHDPSALAVAAASPDIGEHAAAWDSDGSPGPWSWLKWLPHVDLPGCSDGAGAARRLATSVRELPGLLDDLLRDRAPSAEVPGAQQSALKHVLVIVDDPLSDARTPLPGSGLAGTTVVRLVDDESLLEQAEHRGDELVLRVADGTLERREHGIWSAYIAQADSLSEAEAAHLARRLGRWDSNPARSSRTASSAGTDFLSLLGIEDASQLDLPSLWAPKPRAAELRVPIGLTSTGEPLFFDLKDESEGGMGPHGLMIGMTGSGKSQTIMAILMALLTTHPADRLVVIYADFKGEAGADAFRDFPQVVTVISNLAEKRSIADRFADTLRGEVARRERLLRDAGRKVRGSAFGSVAEYEEAAAHGHALEPIPTLFVVADEFSLMLAAHPEYAELFDTVARKGRSLRVHILFASQTLDLGKIKDIDKNTSYRICLKVASASVSRQVIGVESAYHIESGKEHKGVGYFVSSPGAAPVKFRASYVDGVYEPPQAAPAAPLPAEPRPISFTAARTTPDEHDARGEGTLASAAQARPLPTARPKKLIATIGEQLAELGPKAPELWLPPLDTPISLGGLISRAPAGALRWPIGEIDRPYEMRRDPLVFDAASSAGNLLVHGGPKSGKSTAVQTLVLAAAAANSPRDVQFYCLDLGGGSLGSLRGLAHVGAVATAHDDELIRRVLAELRQLLAARRRAFREHAVMSVEEFRARRGGEPALDDGFGDVFLVIDELSVFAKANTDQFTTKNPLLNEVAELTTAGLAYGIHVVVTTTSWIDVPLAMRDGLGMRLELRLTDPRDSNVRDPKALRKPAESVPVDQPGRGLTASAEHFLFAVPRLDERDDADGLAEALSRSIDTLNEESRGRCAPSVRLLPAMLDPAGIGPLSPSKDHVVIGVREEDLTPVTLDFAANPLLMVFGDAKSGKTSLLRHLIRALREQHSPEEIAFTVVDRRAHLADEPLFPDNERTTNIDRLVPAMAGLAALLEKRRPADGTSVPPASHWPAQRQTHYLIVDDVDQLPDGPAVSGPHVGRRPWDPLAGLLSQASELGLRVVVTARAAGSGHTIMTNQLLRRCSELQATALMLSGNAQDSGKIRGHRFARLPPGRAVLLDENDIATTLQLAYPRKIEQASLRKENPA